MRGGQSQISSEPRDTLPTQLAGYFWAIAATWTLIAIAAFCWDYLNEKHVMRELVEGRLRGHIELNLAVRKWITSHGGVYVPITDETPANPYLSFIPERDITTPSGKQLTLVNPAYAMRQLSSVFSDVVGISGHLTSLNPIRPQNAPDEWERKALTAFEGGVKEVIEYTVKDGSSYLRLMRPFRTEKGCLKCHAHQGYKEGDIRGGLSVSVPLDEYEKKEREHIPMMILSYASIWFVGLGMVGFGFRKLRHQVAKRAESEDARSRLATAVEHVAESIIITNAAGVITYVNPAFERITGYVRSEAVGKTPAILKSGKHDDSFYKNLWGTLQRGEVWSGHFTNRRKSGRLFEDETTISPIISRSGAVAGYVSVQRDVTKMMAMERQTRQSQKLQAMGTLAGGIAHDFNNVLTAILGYSELLMDDLPKTGEQRENLEEVRKAALRAREMVKQILTFSRQGEGVKKPIQPHSIIKETIKLMRAAIPSSIQIHTKIEENMGHVIVDPTQLSQVVINLCSNAEQAMRDMIGDLDITLEKVTLDAPLLSPSATLPPGDYARLIISDTGVGMDSATIERIFEPFFTTREVGQGSGMGLPIVHGIVTGSGGAIMVYSEPGKGSSFKIYLPIVEDVTNGTQEEAKPIPRGTERILLVDDEESLAKLGKRMLERLGYSVVTAVNGKDAMDKASRDPMAFDVVVTDQTMPIMTGEQLAAELNNIRPNLPVIIATGYSHSINREKAAALGLAGFINKPLMLSELAEAVRAALDKAKGEHGGA